MNWYALNKSLLAASAVAGGERRAQNITHIKERPVRGDGNQVVSTSLMLLAVGSNTHRCPPIPRQIAAQHGVADKRLSLSLLADSSA